MALLAYNTSTPCKGFVPDKISVARLNEIFQLRVTCRWVTSVIYRTHSCRLTPMMLIGGFKRPVLTYTPSLCGVVHVHYAKKIKRERDERRFDVNFGQNFRMCPICTTEQVRNNWKFQGKIPVSAGRKV